MFSSPGFPGPAHADLVSSELHAWSPILICIVIMGSTLFPYVHSIIEMIRVCSAATPCMALAVCVTSTIQRPSCASGAILGTAECRYRSRFPARNNLGSVSEPSTSEGLTLRSRGGAGLICCLGRRALLALLHRISTHARIVRLWSKLPGSGWARCLSPVELMPVSGMAPMGVVSFRACLNRLGQMMRATFLICSVSAMSEREALLAQPVIWPPHVVDNF